MPSFHRITLKAVTPVAGIALALSLAACGSEESGSTDHSEHQGAGASSPAAPESSSPTEETSTEAAPAAQVLEVEIAGDKITPNAAPFEVALGEPLEVVVTSDTDGSLHVHSIPEEFVDFKSGKTEQTLVFKTPGSVEVEDHETGAVVALIEVR